MNTGSSREDSWTAAAHFGKHIPSFFLAQLQGLLCSPDRASPCPSCSSPILQPPLHLHSCWGGLDHGLAIMGLTLKWFAQEPAGREQQLPEEAGCVPATHSQDARLQDLSVPGEAVTKGRPLCPAFLHDFRGATCFY